MAVDPDKQRRENLAYKAQSFDERAADAEKEADRSSLDNEPTLEAFLRDAADRYRAAAAFIRNNILKRA